MARPQPLAASHRVCGRPAEIGELADGIRARLQAEGWEAEVEHRGASPSRILRFVRGDETLTLVVAAPGAHVLQRPHEMEISVAGAVHDSAATHRVVGDLPFTALEISLLASDMPLTSSVAERAADWLPELELSERPLAGHGAIFTIHHQTDFVLLVERALALGIDPELVTVIDKEYSYRLAHRVDAHIRQRLAIPVFRYSQLRDGLSDHIRRVEEARVRRGLDTWTPTVIVDDGGYVLPVLIEEFEPFLNLFCGAVEQTTSGIWKLRPYEHDLPVPIFSVAESELKATVEAHGVAQAAVTNLRTLLPHEKLDGRRAIVVGFGTIGRALAEVLRRQNVHVHVTDRSVPTLVTAREKGFLVGDDLPELIARVKPRFIFSCAEPGAVGNEALAAITSDCVLVSLTSRDVAFDKRALAKLAPGRAHGNVGTLHHRADADCDILLVADGFPINFHFAESMPNQQADLIMASLLVGAITLACDRPAWPAGNDPARANAVLNDGTLLEDFLGLVPAITPRGLR